VGELHFVGAQVDAWIGTAAVGVDERFDVLECSIELSGSDNEVHAETYRGPETRPPRARLASYQDSSISPLCLPPRFCGVPCLCTGGR
jgi:hypothetical protein